MKKLLFLLLLIPTLLTAQSEGYKKLQQSLLAFSPNPNLTVFRGIDYNFAGTFEAYLQTDMGLAVKDSKITKDEITVTFIPKASKNNEVLTVVYDVTTRTDIEGAWDAESVPIINSVEMTGPAHIMVELFTNYWPGKTKLGDLNDRGAFAYKELLGDYITIEKVDDNTIKIKVGKGNVDMDYVATYGINLPKNQ